MRNTILCLLSMILVLFVALAHANDKNQSITIEQVGYENVPGVYGSITSVGSDTLANLMALWAEQFKQEYPHIKFQIQATGSATAPQALTQGTASIGPMSRALTSTEIDRFVRKHGYPPTALIVAIDAIGIYVERNNPLERLTIQQVDAIFSSTRFCGYPQSITHWTQLEVEKFGKHRQLQVFGRNSASGTYDLFKRAAMCSGDYAMTKNEMPSSSSVVQSIASSIGGIGYAALGHKNRNVKALALSQDGQQYYAPSAVNINAGQYPFTRYLYIIVNKAPGEALPLLEQTFLKFVLSTQGQGLVSSTNYYPVTGRTLQRQIRLLSDF